MSMFNEGVFNTMVDRLYQSGQGFTYSECKDILSNKTEEEADEIINEVNSPRS